MEALQGEVLNIEEYLDIRPMNEWMREASSQPVPKQLFDDMWCEGELAILFGDTGRGKSALAVQIGESIARGRAIQPFGLTAKPRDVLLLDFEMSEKQIELRYSADHDPSKGDVLKKKYGFSKRFHRMVVRPEMLFRNNGQPIEEILRELLQPLIVKTRATVLIIDNITHMKRTADSHRETVPLIKELLRLKRRFGLSILAIAHTRKRDMRRGMTVNDMLSAGMLANGVDNIFAIGQSRRDSAERYIKHLKPRNAEALYDGDHVPVFRLGKIGGNFLGFEFREFSSERVLLAEPKDGPNWPLIEKIKQMHDDGDAIRTIAAKLGMSKTVVHRHLQMWHPPEVEETDPSEETPSEAMQDENYFPGCEEYDDEIAAVLDLEDEYEKDCVEKALLTREHYLVAVARAEALEIYKKTGTAPKLEENSDYIEFRDAVEDFEASEGEDVRDAIEQIVGLFNPPARDPVSELTADPRPISSTELASAKVVSPNVALTESAEIVSNVGLLQPPATAGGTDIGDSVRCDPPDAPADQPRSGQECPRSSPLAAMPTELDAHGKLIYVEDYLEDGRPRVWYKQENAILFRYERDPNGTTRTRADSEVFGKIVRRE